MSTKKPRIVIIGAGMAGLTAAHKLHTSGKLFDLHVVEGGTRIDGRVNSSEFCGDRVELGATWIHGIDGSPLYTIAQQNSLLHSPLPWECMDGFPMQKPVTVAEGGHHLPPSIVDPISKLFKNLLNFAQGKHSSLPNSSEILDLCNRNCDGSNHLSVGSFLRNGLHAYRSVAGEEKEISPVGKWRRKPLEEAVFAMHENTQRSYAAVDDLSCLDYDAERQYAMFPGEEITIARGYSSVVESLASVLPAGTIQLGRKVVKIEWRRRGCSNPVVLHFSDGSTLPADHVMVTVSLGVLKRGIREDRNMFDPPLPYTKIRAISRLGFGVVDKIFLKKQNDVTLPSLQMVFHQPDSGLRNPSIPEWIRGTSILYPIYKDSNVVLSWLPGKEALEAESLSEDEIVDGFTSTVNDLLSSNLDLKFEKALRTQWGTDPLFLGSYSYMAVGSTIADMDALSEPLPEHDESNSQPRMQILFAGEATHSTHYSTTHGAYFSGLREANRLLQHYL